MRRSATGGRTSSSPPSSRGLSARARSTAAAPRRHVIQACEDSLRRLGTDYIDLYQYHFPDPNTPIEETLGALDDLVHAGKVRYIGSSNVTGWMVAEAEWTSRSGHLAHFVTAQNEYSLLNRKVEQEVVPACKVYGVGLLPYFPLASGLLTGKYKRGEKPPADSRIAAWGPRGERMLSDENFDIVEKLQAFADARGKTLLDLAFGWLASHDYVPSVIAGATKPEQVEANAKAAEWVLTPDEMAEVDKLSEVGRRREMGTTGRGGASLTPIGQFLRLAPGCRGVFTRSRTGSPARRSSPSSLRSRRSGSKGG